MKTIIFVCTGNTCRSPMAQELLLRYLQEQGDNCPLQEYQVLSAGLFTREGLLASAETVMVLAGENIDLGRHRSRQLNETLVREADYILTMSVSQRDYLKIMFPDLENIETIKQFAAGQPGDIRDPFGEGIEAYRQCLQELKLLIPRIAMRIFEQEEP